MGSKGGKMGFFQNLFLGDLKTNTLEGIHWNWKQTLLYHFGERLSKVLTVRNIFIKFEENWLKIASDRAHIHKFRQFLKILKA